MIPTRAYAGHTSPLRAFASTWRSQQELHTDRTARAEPGSLGWAEQLVLHPATPCDCDDDGDGDDDDDDDDDDQHLVRLLQAGVAGGEEVSQ